MKTNVTVGSLKDQIGMEGPRPFLKCGYCGSEASANKGDYFSYSPKHVFTCCNRPMRLVTKQIVYKEVA